MKKLSYEATFAITTLIVAITALNVFFTIVLLFEGTLMVLLTLVGAVLGIVISSIGIDNVIKACKIVDQMKKSGVNQIGDHKL